METITYYRMTWAQFKPDTAYINPSPRINRHFPGEQPSGFWYGRGNRRHSEDELEGLETVVGMYNANPKWKGHYAAHDVEKCAYQKRSKKGAE